MRWEGGVELIAHTLDVKMEDSDGSLSRGQRGYQLVSREVRIIRAKQEQREGGGPDT